MNTGTHPTKSVETRDPRYRAHALVEIRKYKYLPFYVHSAVLLDISYGGFKAEFTGNAKVAPGEIVWLHIPLQPLSIPSPSHLYCRGKIKWFDPKRNRIGGVFIDVQTIERNVIDQLVDVLSGHPTEEGALEALEQTV